MSKKSPFKESFGSNMVKESKHCSKLKDSTFTIFIDACESNSGLKSLCECYVKFQDCLLTHGLPIKNILFLIDKIQSNIFRCTYQRNKKYFFNFFLNFLNLNSILMTFKKKMTLIADEFLSLRTWKYLVRYISKKSCLREPFNK